MKILPDIQARMDAKSRPRAAYDLQNRVTYLLWSMVALSFVCWVVVMWGFWR